MEIITDSGFFYDVAKNSNGAVVKYLQVSYDDQQHTDVVILMKTEKFLASITNENKATNIIRAQAAKRPYIVVTCKIDNTDTLSIPDKEDPLQYVLSKCFCTNLYITFDNANGIMDEIEFQKWDKAIPEQILTSYQRPQMAYKDLIEAQRRATAAKNSS